MGVSASMLLFWAAFCTSEWLIWGHQTVQASTLTGVLWFSAILAMWRES